MEVHGTLDAPEHYDAVNDAAEKKLDVIAKELGI